MAESQKCDKDGDHYGCKTACSCSCHVRFGKPSDWPGFGPQLGSMGASHQAPPQDAA